MGLYDVTGFKFLEKGLKIKKAKNALYLDCKIHKARQLLQKTCANMQEILFLETILY